MPEFEQVESFEERTEERRQKSDAVREWLGQPNDPYADPVLTTGPAANYPERTDEELAAQSAEVAKFLYGDSDPAPSDPNRAVGSLGGPGPVVIEPEDRPRIGEPRY